MNSLNLDDISSMGLENTDSEVQKMGFADFVKKYQHCCEDEGGVDPEKAKQKSEIVSSSDELSIRSSSLTSIGPVPATSQAKPAVDDAGFNRFLDEWTSKISKEARLKWKKMSKDERSFYAPRDDLSRSSDLSVSASVKRFFIGEVSSRTIRQACDKVCSTLIKSSLCKRKCPKPKGVGKGSKKLGAKRSPKVKSGKCSNPKTIRKCRKPKDLDSATKADKKCTVPKSMFPKFFSK